MEKDILIWVAFVAFALVAIGVTSMVADDQLRRDALRTCLTASEPKPHCDSVIRSQL